MKNILKILHFGKFYSPQRGGIETALKYLAEAGSELGHRIQCVVSQHNKFYGEREIINNVTIQRLSTFGKVCSTPLSPNFLLKSFELPDLLHIHLPNPFAEMNVLMHIKAYKNIHPHLKLVPFLHALPLKQGKMGEIWFSKLTSRLLDEADQILISHPYQLNAFPRLNEWGKKILVIPFATECYSDNMYAKSFEQRKNSKTVSAVGRLVQYKGFDVLIKAWSKLIGSNDYFKLYKLKIVGDGPEYKSLQNLIKKYKLDAFISLLGDLDEDKKNKTLDESVLFIAPSINKSETFGISILEAMGKGLPIITTQIPTGVSALARNGKCGAVIQPCAIDELTRAIEMLLTYPEKRRQAGKENLEFAKQNHSRENLIRAYRQTIDLLWDEPTTLPRAA